MQNEYILTIDNSDDLSCTLIVLTEKHNRYTAFGIF